VGGLDRQRKLSGTEVGWCGGSVEGLDRQREPGRELPDENGGDGIESDAAGRKPSGAALE
jgi:hypothetical protein